MSGRPSWPFTKVNRRYENEPTRDAHLKRQIERLAQERTVQHRRDAVANRDSLLSLLFCDRQSRQSEDQGSTHEERQPVGDEIAAKSEYRDRQAGERGSENVCGVIRDRPERQRPWILRRSRDAGNDGFVNRGEECCPEIEQDRERVDVPDAFDKEEPGDDGRPRQVADDHRRARAEAVGDDSRPRCAENDHDDSDR